MDLSTTPRRATEGVGDLQKTRVAKSVFSIRSLVDVEEAELPAQDDERSPSEFLIRFAATGLLLNRSIVDRPMKQI